MPTLSLKYNVLYAGAQIPVWRAALGTTHYFNQHRLIQNTVNLEDLASVWESLGEMFYGLYPPTYPSGAAQRE